MYGAGSHGMVLLQLCGLIQEFDVILDDVPQKHGYYIPGCTAPIVPVAEIAQADSAAVFLAIHPEWININVDKLNGFGNKENISIYSLFSKPYCIQDANSK